MPVTFGGAVDEVGQPTTRHELERLLAATGALVVDANLQADEVAGTGDAVADLVEVDVGVCGEEFAVGEKADTGDRVLVLAIFLTLWSSWPP
jgi:hypothetical protein